MFLTKDSFAKLAVKTRTIDLPTIGSVNVRELSAGEVMQWDKLTETDDRVMFLVLHGICDEEGKRLFSDNDSNLVKNIGISAINPITTAVLEVSGLTKTAEELKKTE